MKYLYKCRQCKKEIEIEKPMSKASNNEYCPQCNYLMQRKYLPLAITWHDNCRTFDKEGLGDNLILKHHG